MKMLCRQRTVVRGDVVRAGQVVDLSAAESALPAVAAHFSPVAGGTPQDAAGTPVVAGLTRRQAIARIREAGGSVPANVSDARLAERFMEAFGAAGGEG